MRYQTVSQIQFRWSQIPYSPKINHKSVLFVIRKIVNYLKKRVLNPGKAAQLKIWRTKVDKSLPREKQLQETLRQTPNLSMTDVLMLKLKSKIDEKADKRMKEKESIMNEIREQKGH